MSSRRPSLDKSRLRMDSYSSAGRSWRRSRPSSPPRRRELDNVMKKARKEGPDKSNYWNKKLLEVEERDPNRWRHSGFKELYGEGSERKGSNSRSRSPKSRSRSRTRSRSRDRDRDRERERDRDRSRDRSLRPRSPPPRPKSPPLRPVSPLRKSKIRPRSPRSPRSPKSPRSKPKPSTSRSKIPRKSRRATPPPPKARSESLTSGSVSSCSDESCSVCSPKTKRKAPAPPKEKEREQPRAAGVGGGGGGGGGDRERERQKAAETSPNNRPPFRCSRSRSFSVPRSKPVGIEKPRRKPKRKRDKDKTAKTARRRRPVVKVESESERSSSPSPGPRLTLSERFGKMAQWSVDRDMEHHRNLRITAGDQLTVEMDSPPSPPYAGSLSSLPEGSWDDVRIRYTYYKERGYLRDLTLQDYVKWEEWWYKYQDWLEKERCYDRINMYRRRM